LWLLFRTGLDARRLIRLGVNTLLMFGTAFLVFVPLLRYLSENPSLFWFRMSSRLTSLEIPLAGDPLTIWLANTWRALGMFNVRGDLVWVNAIPDVPVLDWVLGACFLIGVIYGIFRLIRYREYPYALLFGAMFVLLLPSTLALAFPEENPSVVRAGGIAPFVMIFAALPLTLWRKQFDVLRSRTLGDVLVGLVLLLVVLLNFQLYFVRYADQYKKAAWNATEIAATLRAFADEQDDWEHLYIVSAPHWVDYRAVGIALESYDFDSHLVEDQVTLRAQADDPAAKIYALKNQDSENLEYLRGLYPGGQVRRVVSPIPGRSFIVFYAPARR
jgi:hypothetical protein